MARASLARVRFFTLTQVAERWYRELGIREDQLLLELRAGIIGVPLRDRGRPLPDVMISEDELPADTERVDRDWILRFADKQGWEPPTFLIDGYEPTRRIGRPSDAGEAAMAVYQERSDRGAQSPNTADEARQIHAELMDRGLAADAIKPTSIEKRIRNFRNTPQLPEPE